MLFQFKVDLGIVICFLKNGRCFDYVIFKNGSFAASNMWQYA